MNRIRHFVVTSAILITIFLLGLLSPSAASLAKTGTPSPTPNKPFPTQTFTPLPEERQVDALFQTYMKSANHAPGIAVAVISYTTNPKRAYLSEFYYGTTTKDSPTLPNQTSIFGIGSESKVFTAVIFAGFLKEGLVKLDDPIQKYLPANVHAPMYQGKQITLRDLATHRSGLPDSPDNRGTGKGQIAPVDYTLQDFYTWLSSYKLTRAPGSQWEYSNAGFDLLGALMTQIANQSYDALMGKYMGIPLDMPDTVVFLSDTQMQRAAQGYDDKGVAAPLMTVSSSKEVIGGGQLSSTIHDMEHFMEASLDEVGDKDTQAIFDLTQQVAADGGVANAQMSLGWQIVVPPTPQDAARYWKDGAARGFHTFMTFIKGKDQKVAVMMLGNGIDPSSGYEEIGVKIVNLVTGTTHPLN